VSNLPVVCIFGVKNISLKSEGPVPYFETDDMDCRCYLTDDNLSGVLAYDRPSVIVSFGKEEDFVNLMASPFSVRKKWIHFPDTGNIEGIGIEAFRCFLHNAVNDRQDLPLISVFTPAYKTGSKIMKPFSSLLSQTYPDWEWVIIDDSDDDGETFSSLSEIADSDPRVRVYKNSKHSGVIGSVKGDACALCRGSILVELDHDDEIVPQALEWLFNAYTSHPDVGFVYTDFAECFEDGTPWEYGPGWGMGYGSYRTEEYGGIEYKVVNSPHVNAKVVRHIVAMPNHIRSWRTDVYRQIGGHGNTIHVADDYELMLRTFLNTRMGHIPRMGYVQYRNETGNTHQVRNAEIQRLVRYFSQYYDDRIHERLLELGVDDFVWKEGELTFAKLLSIPNQEPESHCTIRIDV